MSSEIEIWQHLRENPTACGQVFLLWSGFWLILLLSKFIQTPKLFQVHPLIGFLNGLEIVLIACKG
jgi:hypothetical protein